MTESTTDAIRLITDTLDGKRVAYTNLTVFYVQTRRRKHSFKTKYKITGSLMQAIAYYRAVNVGNGYIKRLWSPDLTPRVLARMAS